MISPTRSSSRSGTTIYFESVQIIMAESFGVQGRDQFYEEAGAIRDPLQVIGFLDVDRQG